MNSIGTIIRERRKALGITQQELADLAQVNINTVVGVERGTTDVRLSTLTQLCDIMGLQVDVSLKD